MEIKQRIYIKEGQIMEEGNMSHTQRVGWGGCALVWVDVGLVGADIGWVGYNVGLVGRMLGRMSGQLGSMLGWFGTISNRCKRMWGWLRRI